MSRDDEAGPTTGRLATTSTLDDSGHATGQAPVLASPARGVDAAALRGHHRQAAR